MTQPPDQNSGGQYWQQPSPTEGVSPEPASGPTQHLPGSVPTPPPAGFDSPEGQLPPTGDQSPIDPFASPAQTGEGEPKRGRDRFLFTFIWEAVLVAVVAGLGFWLYQTSDGAIAQNAGGDFSFTALTENLGPAIVLFALVALAFGLTVRMGAPNIGVAVFPAVCAGLIVNYDIADPAEHALTILGLAVVPTVISVVMMVVFRFSPWLSGLVAGLSVIAVSMALIRPRDMESMQFEEVDTSYWPGVELESWQLLAGVIALCAVAGALGTLGSMRDRFTKVADMVKGDEPRSASLVSFLAAGTFVASLLGIASVHALEFFSGPGSDEFFPGLLFPAMVTEQYVLYDLTNAGMVFTFVVVALIVVGLAGTSLKGRRGGILGIPLAAATVYLLMMAWQFEAFSSPHEMAQLAVEETQWTWVGLVALVIVALMVSVVAGALGEPKEPAELEGNGEVAPFGPGTTPASENEADLGLFGQQDQDVNTNMFPPPQNPQNQ